ncbi:SDR family NAD(P)-dependent oxidoreductase [Leptospira noguchii]|uniref:SDR family NAD(P)-dependent oxidoreductase n=2 Tax=Leptospira noguchii TaxID=28182 RepID=A0A9Q8VUR2_9LEPT|nr:SDR family NAD(P)-dependent oxidoreductase [Leptospira noguchii]EMO25386.1 tetrahydrofolate dehydrogenase/cyclohydrolase, NAD(P)-binding-like domain protein [Leptospira interrogans serovar Bataviae str. HAI135]EKR72470.1 tetrahydrofolate dehydrogenase/cyclohydrolase, NAD(P)-binding-like domain protein [Leptospira noguchii str. 2006001870]EMN00958.1 tetrahydrofolate dehydrogenase/cyclohydrolase, NAD(P)-binding-like domain protein [Leptospira noguchii str. 2007001578]EMS85180.1 tetrahydrofolat
MAKKIIVVGASSGIGKELATLLLEQGHTVTLVARRDKELKSISASFNSSGKTNVFVIKHDVTNFDQTEAAFQKAVKSMKGLDEIYYASGIMHNIKPDEFDVEKDISMLNTNLLGCVAWLNPAANLFQNQKSGKIIGISSIAGDRGRRGNPVYNASKAGMNTYLEALRNRLSVLGVQVLTVKPGFIDTAMTKGMKGLFWLISAKEAAEIILKAADSGKENIYVPARWGLVGLIIRCIPSFIFRRLSI